MDSQQDIRAQRLAKLEAASRRAANNEQNSNRIPGFTDPSELDRIPSPLPPSSSEINVPPIQTIATASSNSSVSTPKSPAVTFERWRATEMKRVLSVTMDLEDASHTLISLESLGFELNSTDLIDVDDPDTVLTSLIFEQGVLSNYPSVLQYLFKSWSRASDAKRLVRPASDNYAKKMEFYNEVIRLCSAYASILFFEPDTFVDNPNLNKTIDELISNFARYSDFLIAILNAVVDNETQLEFLNSILPILTSLIDASIDNNTMSIGTASKYNTIIEIMDRIAANKKMCAFISHTDIFMTSDTDSAIDLEMNTFLGRILRVSPLLSKISASNYIGIINKNEVKIINESLASSYSLQVSKLFQIVNSLIRVNAESRNRVLEYFAHVVNQNHLRTSEHSDPTKLSSDSLMMNISLVLIKLTEPILREGNQSKIDKISTDYLSYSSKLIDITEETRINSTIQDFEEHYKSKMYEDDKELNFVSQCFYLMLAYLHYGIGGAISSVDRKNKALKHYKGQLKQYTEMLEQSKLKPNPISENLFKMRMDPLRRKITEIQNDLYSLNIYFLSRSFQLETFDIVVGSCEFLVRLIDNEHQYHPSKGNFFPYLQIPLHNMDNDMDRLDDVEYLRSVSPDPFKYFPEIFIEGIINYCHFISRCNNNPMLDNNNRLIKLVEFAVILLRCPELISNPHLKARLAEVLFFGSLPLQSHNGEVDGFMISIFTDDEVVQQNLMISLLDFYVMVEKTGASSQFYDKFNSRFHISYIIEKLWKFDVFKKDLRLIATKHQKFFIRFVARMLNDTTYLLDESLNHLQTIHSCQREINRRAKGMQPETEESDKDLEQKLAESERSARSYVQLGNKDVLLFNLFTSETPDNFTIVEIVDRLAGMLNYNLTILVGPGYNNLKVSEPEKYNFDPTELLLQLCSIFLNLSRKEEFARAVAKDLRSFEPANFLKALSILKKNYKLPDQQFESDLLQFVEHAKQIRAADDEEELELGDVPDEFLDPLMYTLMKDPVKLPTSKISIDRSVLKAHLMNDPTDPFNRMPLKMEEVTDDTELRDQINAWIQKQRLESVKRKTANTDEDGDIEMQ